MNSVWKILLAKLFAKVLLDKIYEKIKIDIHAIVDTCIYFNYVTNSSSNINYEKIVNLYVHT